MRRLLSSWIHAKIHALTRVIGVAPVTQFNNRNDYVKLTNEQVSMLLHAFASDLRDNRTNNLPESLFAIRHNPLPFQVLEVLLDIDWHDPDDALIEACLIFLEEELFSLNDKITQNRVWAKEKMDDVQSFIAQNIFLNDFLPLDVRVTFLEVLKRANVELGTELRSAIHHSMIPESGVSEGANLEKFIEGLEQGLADGKLDEGTIHSVVIKLWDQFLLFNDGFVERFALACLASKLHAIREIPFMMLFALDKALRNRLLATLMQSKNIHPVSPISRTRLQQLALWLDKKESKPIAGLIKHIRNPRACDEPLLTPLSVKVYGSQIDGAGCQSVCLQIKLAPRAYCVAGYIVKDGYGIKDLWVFENCSYTESQKILRGVKDVEEGTGAVMLTMEWFYTMTAYGIALNLKHNKPLPYQFIRVLEFTGEYVKFVSDDMFLVTYEEMWKKVSKFAQIETTHERLYQKLTEEMDGETYPATWFECDQQLDDDLAQYVHESNYEFENMVNHTLCYFLPARRDYWFNHFVRAAYWAKNQKNARKEHYLHYLCIASQLAHSTEKMQNIEGMICVAELTVMMFVERHEKNQQDEADVLAGGSVDEKYRYHLPDEVIWH